MDAAEMPKRKRGKPKKPKAPKTPSKVASRSIGRPSLYTPELGDTIAARLATGETLRSICRTPGFPDERRVREWAMNEEHPFAQQYDRARMIGYHSMADSIIEISDDKAGDWIEKTSKGGNTFRAVDETAISRAKLQVDSRKWLLSKMLPKIYGDRLTTEHTGPDGGPIQVTLTNLERARRIALVFEEAAAGGNTEQLGRLLSIEGSQSP